jgi:Lrp/AsnC family transcriptional regulator for asnA, asnC and gidA
VVENDAFSPQADRLDETDIYILDALRRDGREAFSQIAEQLGVSPGMIRQRYNRLVEMGFLKVVAITNPLQRGFKTMAMVGIRTEGRRMLEIAAQVAALPEVVYLIVVSGQYDLMAEVFCRDPEELLKFLTDKLYAIDGVREVESFLHLKIIKEVYF